MLKDSNLVELIRKVNESMSYVLSNKDSLDLNDLESISSFLNEYSSMVNTVVAERKAIQAKEEKEKILKANFHKTIDRYMRGLLNSINSNDIYIDKEKYGIKYDIKMVKEHIGICEGLLISIEHYNSYCKNNENEFLSTVSFIKRYLNKLYSILKEESSKNRDLSSMWDYVLSKNNLM